MFTFALSSCGQKGKEERTLRMVETPVPFKRMQEMFNDVFNTLISEGGSQGKTCLRIN